MSIALARRPRPPHALERSLERGSGHPNRPTRHSSSRRGLAPERNRPTTPMTSSLRNPHRPDLLRGRVLCAHCERRMHGQTRTAPAPLLPLRGPCPLPRYHRRASRDVPPRRAHHVALDEWLGELFAPERALRPPQLSSTALADGPAPNEHIERPLAHRPAPARAATCRDSHRDLDSPAARPSEVPSWLDEAAAERRNRPSSPWRPPCNSAPSLTARRSSPRRRALRRPSPASSTSDLTRNARDALRGNSGDAAHLPPRRNQVATRAPTPCATSACRRGDLNPHVLSDTRPST